jgi:hypothetical protein
MTKYFIPLPPPEPPKETSERGNAGHGCQAKDGPQCLVETHQGGMSKTTATRPQTVSRKACVMSTGS